MKKVRSIAKMLEQNYGGKWKYEYPCQWVCDDNIRYVWRVATGKDMNGEYTGDSSLCMYFKDKRTPKWI